MRRGFIALVIAIGMMLFIRPVVAVAGYGDWKVYAAYHEATDAVVFNGLVYVLSGGGLYSYDPEYTEVVTYDKSTELSDNGIFGIRVCEATGQLVIVYTNGNVDLLDTGGNIYNMSELKSKSMSDKTINDLYVNGQYVYISTNSGIVVLDTKRKVFASYYNFGCQVMSMVIDEGYIVALTNNGVYKGLVSANLLDSNKWNCTSQQVLSRLISLDGTFYALTGTGRLALVKDKDSFEISTVDNSTINGYKICGERLFLFSSSSIYVYDTDGNSSKSDNPLGIYSLVRSGNTYWLACGAKGLMGAAYDGSGFTVSVSSVIPGSPLSNDFYKLRHYGSRLLSVGGALEIPYVRRTFSAQMKDGDDWSFFENDSIKSYIGEDNFYNALDIVQDPDDADRHFVSAVTGLYEFQGQKMVNHYTYDNSPLTSILPTNWRPGYYVRVSGLAFDSQDNLWMLNCQVDTVVKILKADGTWQKYYCPEIANHPVCDQTMFDSRGWAWIVSRVSGSNNAAGVFILNTNGTVDSHTDDTGKLYTSMTNQDGTSYVFNRFNCVVEDLNGAVWMGTNIGPLVTFNPSAIFDSNFTVTQCKVPRNDGTGYADYLLNEVEVSCIAVDGGNRKWMGTQGNGVYLVSADGTEILEHFTADNSPLLSDDIYSISIDGSTGEVFFGTKDGLVSYMGNATDPEEKFDKDLVKVYPNPVRPSYTGKIVVRGLMASSDVKIVNAAGRLVHEGTSIGGSYTWDGLTSGGERAASGVYYILATDEDGNSGVATKFLIVKE